MHNFNIFLPSSKDISFYNIIKRDIELANLIYQLKKMQHKHLSLVLNFIPISFFFLFNIDHEVGTSYEDKHTSPMPANLYARHGGGFAKITNGQRWI